jgi:hypothetical protein
VSSAIATFEIMPRSSSGLAAFFAPQGKQHRLAYENPAPRSHNASIWAIIQHFDVQSNHHCLQNGWV